jgi:hypothetical protein
VRREKDRKASEGSTELPFGVYLLLSAVVAIAAVRHCKCQCFVPCVHSQYVVLILMVAFCSSSLTGTAAICAQTRVFLIEMFQATKASDYQTVSDFPDSLEGSMYMILCSHHCGCMHFS